jgi:chromosome partitioning protein
MAKIVGVIQVKGGVGRSTIATNLAAAFSLMGHTTLVDCDLPQGTSSSWFALRQADFSANNLALATVRDHRELVKQVKESAATSSYLIIDGPPRIAELTRAIIMVSNLCLIPLGASAAEIWSVSDLLQTITEAGEYRSDVDARILWTRFRGQTREAQELLSGGRQVLGLPELNGRLGYRVAYSEALARGLSVEEWQDAQAHAEMRALVNEITGILGEKKS